MDPGWHRLLREEVRQRHQRRLHEGGSLHRVDQDPFEAIEIQEVDGKCFS
jgi:hypothetical protein